MCADPACRRCLGYDMRQLHAQVRPCVVCRRSYFFTDPQQAVCTECQR